MTVRVFITIWLLLSSTATVGIAGDLLPIVFDDSEHVTNGKKQKYDLYYIFIGDKGVLRTGSMIQIATVPGDPDRYTLIKAQFAANKEFTEVSVFWPVEKGQKIGNVEKARLVEQKEDGEYLYSIYEHNDRSQVGTKEKVRATDFRRLPEWVREAVFPYIQEKLPQEQRALYHRMQAEQLKSTSEIIQRYLDAIP